MRLEEAPGLSEGGGWGPLSERRDFFRHTVGFWPALGVLVRLADGGRTDPSLWEKLSQPHTEGDTACGGDFLQRRKISQHSQPQRNSWLVPSPRPTPDPRGWGSCRELVTEPSLGRPMASNIQSDIIWLQFLETKIRQRKFRLLLQSSKKNRGEGQKTDHKRIFVTQSQLGKTGMSSTLEKRPRNLLSPHYKERPSSLCSHAPTRGFSIQPHFTDRPKRCQALSSVSCKLAEALS